MHEKNKVICVTVFRTTDWLARTKCFIIALLPFTLSEDAAISIRYFILEQDVHLFLASSCSNDYFHMYAIIYCPANRLVFQNMVTYKNFCTSQISTVNSHLR